MAAVLTREKHAGKKIFNAAGTADLMEHYPLVTAETPLPSKRW
jgi:hypothetical protein